MRRWLCLLPVLIACFVTCHAEADLQLPFRSGVAYFPDGLISIEDEAFEGTSFQVVVLHEGLDKLGDYAFAGNKNLCAAILPNSLIHIGKGALPSNEGLTLYAHCGGAPQDWAAKNGVRFISIELLLFVSHQSSVIVRKDVDEQRPALQDETEGSLTLNRMRREPLLRRQDRPEMDIPEAEIP